MESPSSLVVPSEQPESSRVTPEYVQNIQSTNMGCSMSGQIDQVILKLHTNRYGAKLVKSFDPESNREIIRAPLRFDSEGTDDFQETLVHGKDPKLSTS